MNRFKTRAELDAEPRLMQFEVTGLCPRQRYAGVLPVPAVFPLAVFVMAEPFTDKNCGGVAYEVSDARVSEIRASFGISTDSTRRRVCEHMGRIIE